MRSKAASICANKIALSFDTLRNDKTVTKSQINSNPLSAERPVTKAKTPAPNETVTIKTDAAQKALEGNPVFATNRRKF
ncbi:hypothetical protein LBMAG49_23940 [Planctomycetota bacterium]|nr:hypothetical protein LBMAG49_23940 [Planctomycetota bacterium]